MKKTLILITLLCTLVTIGQTALASPVSIGKPAPDFSLPNASGKEIHLHDFKGKIVVLEWYNPHCPFVKKFYGPKAMQKYQEQLTGQGVVWMTITSSADGKQGFISQEAAPAAIIDAEMKSSELLLDHEGVVGRAYGARTTPHMFVIDSKGLLAYAGAIDDSPSTRSSDIANASNYVLQAVSELSHGKPVSEPHTSAYGCSVKY